MLISAKTIMAIDPILRTFGCRNHRNGKDFIVKMSLTFKVHININSITYHIKKNIYESANGIKYNLIIIFVVLFTFLGNVKDKHNLTFTC